MRVWDETESQASSLERWQEEKCHHGLENFISLRYSEVGAASAKSHRNQLAVALVTNHDLTFIAAGIPVDWLFRKRSETKMAKPRSHEKSTLVTCHPDGRGARIGKGEKTLSSVDLVGASRDSRQLWCGKSDPLVDLYSCENLYQPRARILPCFKLGGSWLGSWKQS